MTCNDPENTILSINETTTEPMKGNRYWYANFYYTPIKVGSCVYTLTIAIPDTDIKISKEVEFIVTEDIDSAHASVNLNDEYFDKDGMYIKTELVMPDDGNALVIPFPDEAIPTFTAIGDTKRGHSYNFGGANYDYGAKTLSFSKPGKYDMEVYSDISGSNIELTAYLTFIVNSSVEPTIKTPTIDGIPNESILISDAWTWVELTSKDSECHTKWEVSCNNDTFDISSYTLDESLNIRISCDKPDEAATITVKAYYYGYEANAAVATFKVHTKPEEKPTLVIDLGRDSTYTLYSGENDGALTIKTSGSFYLGSIEFSDKSPIHEFEPVITLTPNDDGGVFDCSVYSYNGNIGDEDGQQLKIAKLKYESLPAVGTHEYTLHVEIPGTDYIAESPVTINVIDGTAVLPHEIVLQPETEALFTNNVYNRALYLDSNGQVSVTLNLDSNLDEKYSHLDCILDKYTDGDEHCTKSFKDGKYVFTFEGAKTHYIGLHLTSDFSNWYIDRTLSFNVLDPEPYYPPYIPPEEPTAMPTAEPVPVPTQAPTAEPVPVPTVAPTVEPAPTPTPAPIKEVTAGGKNLNVRLSPVSGAVVAKLPDGTRLEVLGTENGWSRVRATLPDGSVVEGFVMDVYLSDTAPTASPAVPTPAAPTTSPAVPTPAATVTAQPGATTTPAPLPSGEPTEVPTAPVEVTAMVNTNGSALRLRSNPSTRSDVLARMPNGAEITILESVDGWTRIKFVAQNGDEYEGWASSDFIKPAERPTPTAAPLPTAAPEPTAKPEPTATPAASSAASVSAGGKKLNLRSAPGASDSNVAAKLPDGAELIVLEYGDEWSLCSYNGITGYCATRYLKFN